jgi:hypothetical protein
MMHPTSPTGSVLLFDSVLGLKTQVIIIGFWGWLRKGSGGVQHDGPNPNQE